MDRLAAAINHGSGGAVWLPPRGITGAVHRETAASIAAPTDVGAVVDLGWVDGRRKRKYVSAASQGQVLEKLRRLQRDAAVRVISDDQITVGQFLNRWLQTDS